MLTEIDAIPHHLDASKSHMKWVEFLDREGGVLTNKREDCSPSSVSLLLSESSDLVRSFHSFNYLSRTDCILGFNGGRLLV